MPDRWGAQMAVEPLVLRTAIGKYPNTAGLRNGQISSNLVTLSLPISPSLTEPLLRWCAGSFSM